MNITSKYNHIKFEPAGSAHLTYVRNASSPTGSKPVYYDVVLAIGNRVHQTIRTNMRLKDARNLMEYLRSYPRVWY